jgi:hypothetical protein
VVFTPDSEFFRQFLVCIRAPLRNINPPPIVYFNGQFDEDIPIRPEIRQSFSENFDFPMITCACIKAPPKVGSLLPFPFKKLRGVFPGYKKINR